MGASPQYTIHDLTPSSFLIIHDLTPSSFMT